MWGALSLQVYITLSIQRLVGIELCRAGHVLPRSGVCGICQIFTPTTQEVRRGQIRLPLNGRGGGLRDPVGQRGFPAFGHRAFDQRAGEREDLIGRVGPQHIQRRRIVAVEQVVEQRIGLRLLACA